MPQIRRGMVSVIVEISVLSPITPIAILRSTAMKSLTG